MKNKRQIAEHLVSRLFAQGGRDARPVKIHCYCMIDGRAELTEVLTVPALKDWLFHELNTLPPELEGDQ